MWRWPRRARHARTSGRKGLPRPDPAHPEPSAVELFDRHGVAVYSLALAMLGEPRVAADVTRAVLVDSAGRSECRAAEVIAETHRRAAAYLRYLRQWRPASASSQPVPAAGELLGHPSPGRTTLQLVVFRGYTGAEVAQRLGTSHTEVRRILHEAVGAIRDVQPARPDPFSPPESSGPRE